MDKTNRCIKICRRLTELDEMQSSHIPLTDAEVRDIVNEQRELNHELEALNVGTK